MGRFSFLGFFLLCCFLSATFSKTTNKRALDEPLGGDLMNAVESTGRHLQQNSNTSTSRLAPGGIFKVHMCVAVCPDGTPAESYRCGSDTLSAADHAAIQRVSLNGAIQCTPICGPDDATTRPQPDPIAPQQDCSQYVCVHNNCGATDLGGSDVQVIRGGCDFSDEAGWFVCQGGFTVDRQTYDKVSNGACAPACGQPQLSCQFPARFGPPILQSPSPEDEDEEDDDMPSIESNCENGAEPDGFLCSCSLVDAADQGTLQQAILGQDTGCVPWCGDPSELIAACERRNCNTDICIGPRADVMCAASVPQQISNAINTFDCSPTGGRDTVACRGPGGSFVEVDEPSFQTIRNGVCLPGCDVDVTQTSCRFNPIILRTFLNESELSPSPVEPSVPPEEPPTSEAAPSSTAEPEVPPSSVAEPSAPPSVEPSAEAPSSESEEAPASEPEPPASESDEAPESEPEPPASESDIAPESEPEESDIAPESEPEESDYAPESEPDESDYAPESEPEDSDYAPESEPEESDYAPESEPDESDYAPESEPEESDIAPESEPEESDIAPESEPEASASGMEDICEIVRRQQAMLPMEIEDDDAAEDIFDNLLDLPEECLEPVPVPSAPASEPEPEPSAPASEPDEEPLESEVAPSIPPSVEEPAEEPTAAEASAPAPESGFVTVRVRGSDNSVYEGPWGDCSEVCRQAAGEPTQERVLTCRNPFGVPLPADQCNQSDFERLARSQGCNISECTENVTYELGEWSSCSKECAEFDADTETYVPGEQERPIICFRDGERFTGESCDNLGRGRTRLSRPCNSNPCEIVTYSRSEWGECSCSTRRQQRNVTCVILDRNGEDGEETDQVRCEAFELNRPSDSRRCNPTGCEITSRKLLQLPAIDLCQGLPCSKRGDCQVENGNCECDDGYDGVDCQVDNRGAEADCPPPGLLNQNGSCCPSGVFDLTGYECCEGENDNVQLDADGNCCQGTLDMCGVCNGNSVLDSLGRCCNATLDGNGLCCYTGQIDDCGVCDGDGSSCYTELQFAFDLSPQQIRNRCEEPISQWIRGSLALENASTIELVDIQPGEQTENDATFRVDSVAMTFDAIRIAILPSPGQFAQSVPECVFARVDISKRPHCGNDVCEIGEARTSSETETELSCPEDCLMSFTWCPLEVGFNEGRVACSGHGLCLYGSGGQCECFDGYTGENCDECAPGFYLLNDGTDKRCFPRQNYEPLGDVELESASTDPSRTEDGRSPLSNITVAERVPNPRDGVEINRNDLEEDDVSVLAYVLPCTIVPLLLLLFIVYYLASKRNREAMTKTTEELLEKKREEAPLYQSGQAKTESSIWKDFTAKLASHVGLRNPDRRMIDSMGKCYVDSPLSSKRRLADSDESPTSPSARLVPPQRRPRELPDDFLESGKHSSIASPSALDPNIEHPRARLPDLAFWDPEHVSIKRDPAYVHEGAFHSAGEQDSDRGPTGETSGETSNRAAFHSTGETQNMSTIDEGQDDKETLTESTQLHSTRSEGRSASPTPRTAGSQTLTDSD